MLFSHPSKISLTAMIASTSFDDAVSAMVRRSDTAGLQRLAVWDTLFFARIAQCGYEYEQFHAFFPLIPRLLAWLSGECHHQTSAYKDAITCTMHFGLLGKTSLSAFSLHQWISYVQGTLVQHKQTPAQLSQPVNWWQLALCSTCRALSSLLCSCSGAADIPPRMPETRLPCNPAVVRFNFAKVTNLTDSAWNPQSIFGPSNPRCTLKSARGCCAGCLFRCCGMRHEQRSPPFSSASIQQLYSTPACTLSLFLLCYPFWRSTF